MPLPWLVVLYFFIVLFFSTYSYLFYFCFPASPVSKKVKVSGVSIFW